MDATTLKQFLTDREAAIFLGISKASVWRYAKDPRFPQPVRLGPGSTRWRLSDLLEYADRLRGEV